MSTNGYGVLCMNCGAYYDPSGDCPNLADGKHSTERAARIARYLLERRCEHPRALDVRDAGNAIDAIYRG